MKFKFFDDFTPRQLCLFVWKISMQPKNIVLKNSSFKISKLSFSVALGGALLTQFGITTFAEANEIVQNEVVPSVNKKILKLILTLDFFMVMPANLLQIHLNLIILFYLANII